MKKHFKIIVAIAMALQCSNSIAQNSKEPKDTTRQYFTRLATSTNNADKELLETKLYQLLKSAEEEDWYTASNFFYQLKKAGVSDSIAAAQKIKFPLGMSVRYDEAGVIYDEKDPVKKEAVYKAWLKKFPPEKMGKDRISYDYARSAVAVAYARANNVAKALAYVNMIETKAWKGEGWAQTASALVKNDHLKEAALLYKKAVANSYLYLTTNRSQSGAGFAAAGYASYSNSLAEILYKQKKYPEALKYVKQAHDSSKRVRANINSNYANILMALGKNKEAFEKINEAVKEGQATEEMKENLKLLYVKVKGSKDGYDEYMASLNKILAEKIRKELAKKIINLPAAMFTLKDVDGNTVSLADYKGKVVVVDFWATWCGPCKKSFPAMKMAVNKFKDDPNVKFLFIHTWEHDSTATADAKKYVTDNNYPFIVLMDLKDAVTGNNTVVENFKVSSIPTKFIIDKNGNIRFTLSGFEGGNDAAVEEIAAMIELAQKS